MFGDKPVTAIVLGDVEAWREKQLSPVTINHDLKLLRKMFNWGIPKGYVERTPFKIGTEPAVQLDRETPRNRRFESDDIEKKLRDAAGPHLRAVIIALLETACRPGEILSLQWKDVSLERNEIIVRAEKAKTRTARSVPIRRACGLSHYLRRRTLSDFNNDWSPAISASFFPTVQRFSCRSRVMAAALEPSSSE